MKARFARLCLSVRARADDAFPTDDDAILPVVDYASQ